MSISIYYSASRTVPLSPAERVEVDAVVARHPLNTLIAECGVSEGDFDGEGFIVYPTDENTEPGVVFEGATRLPLCSEDAMLAATQYWCRLLSEVRRALPGTAWRVHIDDHDITWDEKLREYDPSE